MSIIESTESTSYFLPEEIWVKIFDYLRPFDILRARLVCKQWAFLSTLPRIKKKLRLRLDEVHTPLGLRNYLTENSTNYLPVHGLYLVNLEDDLDLEFILRTFASELRSLKLKNCPVFKAMAAASLTNIEELYFNFYETSPDFVGSPDLRFMRSYQKLSSLNVKCPDELIGFGGNVLQQLLESDMVFPLQHLHLTYHFDVNDEFLRILTKYAATLKELEVYFDTQPYYWCPASWIEVLYKLKNLEILRISGDCNMQVTSAFFDGLPESAPLRLIELDGIKTLNDDILKLITSKWMNSIIHLSIFFSGRITKTGAAEIWKLRKNLESLQIGYCRTLGIKEILTAVASETNYSLRQLCTYSMGCVSEEYLCTLARNLPNLEVLDLSDNAQGLTNRVLTHIFRHQTRLREVILDGCFGFDDSGIAGSGIPEWSETYPITRLRNLEVLSLENCQRLRKNFIEYLVFPALRTLKLSKLRHITAAGFRKIVDNCPTLEVLHVAYCHGLTDEVLYYICDNLKLLHELNIENCIGLSADAIDYALKCSHIRFIAFTKNENFNTHSQIPNGVLVK